MLLGILIIIMLFLMGWTFLVGLVLFIIGHYKKTKLKKAGLIIGGIPVGIVSVFILFSTGGEIFSSKPDAADLVGTYHIVEVTQLDMAQSNYNNYVLTFYDDHRFTLTSTPYVEVCSSGNYDVDYEWDYNELSFDCPGYFTSAHIVRGFGSFRIEFIIGDPDSGESIFFEKIED